ncbi:hypothetical protein [Streptomyces sp. NPDC018833]|uniref:hypothetical protein n=1 Tax=Streptomyces sp. NPDC018833 TaxID=3365053 RepID=UPI0037B5E967
MAKKQFPCLLGHGEIAFLFGVERQTSQLWKTRGVLGEPDVVVSGKKYMDVYQWRVRRSFVTEDAMISGSPLWLLDTVLEDAEQRGRVTVQEGIDRIRAGSASRSSPAAASPRPSPSRNPYHCRRRGRSGRQSIPRRTSPRSQPIC